MSPGTKISGEVKSAQARMPAAVIKARSRLRRMFPSASRMAAALRAATEKVKRERVGKTQQRIISRKNGTRTAKSVAAVFRIGTGGSSRSSR